MNSTADCSPRRSRPQTLVATDTRHHRLDELVSHLSGCHPTAARRALAASALDDHPDLESGIDAVADALVAVKASAPARAATLVTA
jgi:hypothetical protein